MIPRPKLNKIPGELPKSKPEQYVEDFSKLTKAQLLEIRDRELKLLSNKARISKLPDKGQRIKDFYEKVEKEISHRDEVESAANLFSELNIAATGKDKLNGLEWTGKYDTERGEPILDSDDEEENPLKIIAQRQTSEKTVKFVIPEKPLITEEDLKEIESFNEEPDVVQSEIIEIDLKEKVNSIKAKLNSSISSQESSSNSLNLEPHALYLIEKNKEGPAAEKFMPYRTTKTNVHDPEKEKLRKHGKHWEITAATPPAIIHAGTKMLSLHDSVEIQMEYMERLKKIHEQQAQERLAAKMARMGNISMVLPEENARKLNKFFGSYRQESDSDHDDNEQKILSDDEVRDDEDERVGGVVYTVYK